jgi:CBS domain-containing protein
MNVGKLCSRGPITASTSASLLDVAQRMRAAHVGAVVIMDGDGPGAQVRGIITDRDIVRAQLARTAELSSLNAADAMTRNPLVLTEENSIDAAIEHLRARDVRRAPVVDRDGRLVGVISVDDLLRQVAANVGALAKLVHHQTHFEERA